MTTFSGQNITIQRGGRIVCAGLHFAVAQGQILALTGPNGSGKTSLLRVMGGLLEMHKGALLWDDEAIIDALPCHFLAPENPLKPALTLRDNLRFWYDALAQDTHSHEPKDLTRHAKHRIIDEAIAKLSLTHLADIPARYFSAGQKRRANLCRLFLHRRDLWLLDEPTTGLDAATKQAVFESLNAHKARGGIAVIATHRPDLWQADVTLDMQNFIMRDDDDTAAEQENAA